MGPKSANQRLRRTHVLGGCENCRRRHTKCDQVQPKCLTCQAVGLECQGYSSSVQFVSEDGKATLSDPKVGTRRHLYTEQARLSMSAQLTEQVEPRSVDNSLAEIDSWSQDTKKAGTDGLAVGPFGVIEFNNAAPAVAANLASAPTLAPAALVMPEMHNDPSSRLVDTPSTLDALTSLPDYLQWSDLFDLDFENWLSQQPDNFAVDATIADHDFGLQSTSTPYPAQPPVPIPQSIPAPSNIDDLELKNEAPTLVKHFSDHVVAAIAALPFNTKSPYKVLNVAAAVQTLADIMYLGRAVKHANAANLYSLLACSAYHIAMNPSGSDITNAMYWNDIAFRAGQRAKEHLQKSLQTELQGPNKAKYKDQLMALMSTLTYSIIAGNQRDARCYMIDAERLLRVRGLAKRQISRRARILHHMYTWARIVGESTYVLHEDKAASAPIIHMPRIPYAPQPEAGHNARLDDFLRIEQGEDHEEPDMAEQKDKEVGLHDIHLQDPRQHPDSMYLQIYGLPETWLSLLSQTTRLANIKDMLKPDSSMQRSLSKRTTRLEDMVCTFASNHNSLPAELTTTLPPTQYMIRALNSALVIFFYRRIRDVNAWILQSHIDDVINALRHFDLSLGQMNLHGPGTAWPAFIAGCEASPGTRRDVLLKWIETAFWKTGLHCYRAAKDMMKEVWARRDQVAASPVSTRSSSSRAGKSQQATTWIELSREKKEWVILC
ncbi:hypothetical protein PMZ80_011226 [Knufia obscura]|uniref:Zn(2)-C6 fungal-type domain-containing protein n=2 Tax=Knufia TaxID=430999 RepID=A0AAN8EG38_9EURO|nr:hypothetical protein PMZ80_011226 [Knufia obscura]KAK5949947.1 hypothetical protein OHC33_008908 [Knufia fluminis]